MINAPKTRDSGLSRCCDVFQDVFLDSLLVSVCLTQTSVSNEVCKQRGNKTVGYVGFSSVIALVRLLTLSSCLFHVKYCPRLHSSRVSDIGGWRVI